MEPNTNNDSPLPSESGSLDSGGGQAGGETPQSPDKPVDDQQLVSSYSTADTPPPKKRFSFSGLTKGVNLYLIAFFVIVIIAVLVIWVVLKQSESSDDLVITNEDIQTQVLEDLQRSETRVGDITQTLTVEANAIFNGRILIKDNLDVAGSINVGGPLTLPGITVAGISNFDDVEIANNLVIVGNTSIQGTLSLNKSLNVQGNGSFSGNVSAASISTDNIEILGDLQITRHIDTGGSIPTIAKGSGVGGGGTVSISGSDTAGTITVNTGTLPSAGVLATITFANRFNGTPHILISPVGLASADLLFYVIRTSSSFTFETTNNPDAQSVYVFDYFIVE